MALTDFLFELGTEELPPKALGTLSASLEEQVRNGLDSLFGEAAAAQLAACRFRSFATPRRLALLIEQLPTHTPSKTLCIMGPPRTICFDGEGNPSKALQGFARKNSVEVADLQERDGKLCVIREEPAQPIDAALVAVIRSALDGLPIPKRMRWGSRRVEFVRPVHWCVMLLGETVIDAEILGLKTGRDTYGHRFHANQSFTLPSPQDYARKLSQQGYVIADFEERRETIRAQINRCAEHLGCQAVVDPALLDEVTALVEWPVALAGRFEERFLEVPAEALISSMKGHQKYFHVVDGAGQIQPYFITVSNIESTDASQVIAGNEKVIRPRLADAAFFYETDKKQSLESRIERLKPIVFQAQLGSIYDKSQRVAKLAAAIAERIGGDPALAERAGQLAKTDLVSEMVLEFDDLQGLMGTYYARHDGEPEELALALSEQYLPKFAGDSLPTTPTGCALAIADRLDTLTGLFGINQPPTGSKDPFALRRATLGILRIIVERELPLDLRDLLPLSADLHSELPGRAGLEERVLDFMLERFRAWYEEEGVPAEVFLAVVATRPSRPLDFARRIRAVNAFRTLPEAEALAAANKRVSNLLTKQGGGSEGAQVDTALLQDAAEVQLAQQVAAMSESLEPLFARGDYSAAFNRLAGLRTPVDRFFDEVMVMAEDEALRQNRLALLSQLRGLFLRVADISLLQG